MLVLYMGFEKFYWNWREYTNIFLMCVKNIFKKCFFLKNLFLC